MKHNIKKQTTSKEEIDALSDLSDDKNTRQAPKFSLPSLKLNGKEGGYTRTVLTEDGELKTGEDGKAIQEEVKDPRGIILRIRKSFQYIGVEEQLFTNEGGNTLKSIFSVFQKRETKKGFSIQMAFQGTPAQIKEKFPEMKMVQIVYFLLNTVSYPKNDKDAVYGTDLVRLKVKGMSLGHIFDYFKEFSSKEHIFQFETILGEENGKNQFGKFKMATFKKGKEIADYSKVKESLELISAKIEEIEAYYKERDQEMIDFEEGKPIDLSHVGEDKEYATNASEKEDEEKMRAKLKEADEEEEIDVSKIPY